jgi:hypothetical protein
MFYTVYSILVLDLGNNYEYIALLMILSDNENLIRVTRLFRTDHAVFILSSLIYSSLRNKRLGFVELTKNMVSTRFYINNDKLRYSVARIPTNSSP